MIADTVQHAAVKEGRKLASKHPLQRLNSPSRGASALLHVRCSRHQSPSASFDQHLLDSSSVAAASHTPFISMLPINFACAFNSSSSLPEARGKARPEYLGLQSHHIAALQGAGEGRELEALQNPHAK